MSNICRTVLISNMIYYTLINIFGFFVFVQSQSYVGDICILKSGVSGKCQLLDDCATAKEDLIKKHIYPVNCGYQGIHPIVCCNDEEPQKPQKPPTQQKQQPGHISKQKCREYEKYTKVKSRPPILLIDVEETETVECGHEVVELIVGGELAKEKEFPHMVALGYETGNKIQWLCGGSIISEEYILTAGHCLISREFGMVKYVKMGTNDLEDHRRGQQLKVIERIAHPSYVSSSHYNDIGLLKIENKAKMGPSARPACLLLNNKIPTKKAIATGFGKTQFAGQASDKLLKVTLDLFSYKNCTLFYKNQQNRKLLNGVIDEFQVCAGSFDEEKDTCQGDSGGPLQIYHIADDVKCMYDIVGITSFGKACSGNPGVYTRVSHYIEWIESIVWS